MNSLLNLFLLQNIGFGDDFRWDVEVSRVGGHVAEQCMNDVRNVTPCLANTEERCLFSFIFVRNLFCENRQEDYQEGTWCLSNSGSTRQLSR